MKFAAIANRAAREKRIDILLPRSEGPVTVLVRASSALEDQQAVAFAVSEARAKGSPKQEPGDQIYDTALWAHIVATTYLDADSPEDARTRFFDGGAQQVLSGLPTDSIAYLFQSQQEWQEEVSPSYKAKSAQELVAIVRSIAERDGDVFFSRCSPLTQLSSARFMAALLASLHDTNLQNILLGAASTTMASSAHPKQQEKPQRKQSLGSNAETKTKTDQ